MINNISNVLSLIKNHKLKDSIQLLDDVINRDNQNFDAFHLRGICFLRLSEYESAKKDFNKAIYLKPNFPEVYNNLGLLNFNNGENETAIENFLQAIKLNKNFRMPVIGLIKTLSYTKYIPNYDSIFVSMHNEINKIKIQYSENKYIDDEEIKNLIFKSNKFLTDDFKNLEFNNTQIYRRTKNDLDCKRHKKVFNTYNAIPKFCFGCFKVQIELENIIDLIKLYLIFDNINFKNNNTKKCLIEIRPNIPGHYKGLIYCSSFEEAEEIKNEMMRLTKLNLNKVVKCIIKRGCTEYGIKFPEYTNLADNIMDYKPEWENFESKIDKNFPDLIMNKNNNSSIKGISLNDILIIRNWLAYADIIGDKNTEKISIQKFHSNFLQKKLKLN